jgi:hypothetical protein
MTNLKQAAETCPTNPTSVIDEGIQSLEFHRSNYIDKGLAPKWLQLLWWEFPLEHWTALREGSRMTFLRLPEPELKPNSPIDDEQRAVAAAFVDELLELHMLGLLNDESTGVLLNGR